MEKELNKFEFSKENLLIAEAIIAKYPKQNRFSAIMPLLTLAQEQNKGFLTQQVIDYLASYLNVSSMAFNEVANFYSMYHLNPVGENVIYVCNSIVCFVKGSEAIYNLCKKLSNTEGVEVSPDNLFSVKKVECLGACVNAPVIKVNDIFVENVTENNLNILFNNLKNKKNIDININVCKPISIKD